MAGLVPAIHAFVALDSVEGKLVPSTFRPRNDAGLVVETAGVDGRDKPGHDEKPPRRRRPTGRSIANAVKSNLM
jgi:hypothetical protein